MHRWNLSLYITLPWPPPDCRPRKRLHADVKFSSTRPPCTHLLQKPNTYIYIFFHPLYLEYIHVISYALAVIRQDMAATRMLPSKTLQEYCHTTLFQRLVASICFFLRYNLLAQLQCVQSDRDFCRSCNLSRWNPASYLSVLG